MPGNSLNLFRLLAKILSVFAFVIVSTGVLFFAFGYQPDLSFRHIKKTSIIHVTSHYKDVKVFLNGILESEELPYQKTGVLPGTYALTVESPLFLPWKKKLTVKNDFVTKVDDVLLFPQKPALFIKTLNSFIEKAGFFWSKDFLVVKRPEQDYLTLVSFFDDGTTHQQEVKLTRSDVGRVDFLDDQTLLVHYEGTKLVEMVFPQHGNSLTLNLPEGVQRLTFDQNHENLFFLFQGDLWRVPRSELDHFDPAKKNDFRVLLKVDQFSLSSRSIYYLQKGNLLFSDLSGQNPLLIEDDGQYTNLAYTQGQNYGFLILRKGEKRHFYSIDDQGNRLLLTTSLQGNFLVDGNDNLLFVDEAHEVFFYSYQDQKRILIFTADSSLQLLTLLNEGHHFLFREDGALKISDLTFSNVYSIPDVSNSKQIYARFKTIFFLDGQKINSFILL